MAEALVQVTEGSGKKLHGWDRSISSNTVIDEFVLPGEFPYASYTARIQNINTTTANDHILAIWAGSSLNVRIRKIWIRQHNLAGAATMSFCELWRTSSVTPSGGTAVTIGKVDSADATAGASAMTLPTTKGTETGTVPIYQWNWELLAAAPRAPFLVDWEQHPGMKPIIIPAGTTNGIAFKIITGVASASVYGWVEFVETAFV